MLQIPSFDKLEQYLKDPLVLFGFFLYCGALILLAIIKSQLIAQGDGFRLISKLLRYGLVIGIMLITLVFGLKYLPLVYKQPSRAELLNKASPLISAQVRFTNGHSGKTPTTGFRAYLFDNRTLGVDYIKGLNRSPPAITSQVGYTDVGNEDKPGRGVRYHAGEIVPVTLDLANPTNSALLQDGALFIWILPTEPATWEFTPTLVLKFRDSRLDTTIQWDLTSLNESNGYKPFSFSLR